MRRTENDLAAIARGLFRPRRFAADTSALIVLAKLGRLAAVQAAVKLVSIDEVRAEAGPDWPAGMELLPPLADRDYAPLPTDRKLVAQAVAHRLPVLAEDRRILAAVEEAGLPAESCLFLLLRLAAEGRLSPAAWAADRSRLATEFRYDRDRLALADQLAQYLEKNGPP